MFGAMSHADAFERGERILFSLGCRHAAIRQRQLDVFENGEITNEIEALEMKPISRFRMRARSGNERFATSPPLSV